MHLGQGLRPGQRKAAPVTLKGETQRGPVFCGNTQFDMAVMPVGKSVVQQVRQGRFQQRPVRDHGSGQIFGQKQGKNRPEAFRAVHPLLLQGKQKPAQIKLSGPVWLVGPLWLVGPVWHVKWRGPLSESNPVRNIAGLCQVTFSGRIKPCRRYLRQRMAQPAGQIVGVIVVVTVTVGAFFFLCESPHQPPPRPLLSRPAILHPWIDCMVTKIRPLP